MTFALLVFGIIFSVIASLITLILGIVHLATGKSRSGLILGISFIMSLIIFILCFIEAVKRGSNKVKEGIDWVKEQNYENKSNVNWNYHEDDLDSIRIADSLEAVTRDSAIISHSPTQMAKKRKGK